MAKVVRSIFYYCEGVSIESEGDLDEVSQSAKDRFKRANTALRKQSHSPLASMALAVVYAEMHRPCGRDFLKDYYPDFYYSLLEFFDKAINN